MRKVLLTTLTSACILFVLELFTYSTSDSGQPVISNDTIISNAAVSAKSLQVFYFAGEKVPHDKSLVYERLNREIRINKSWQSQTFLLKRRASRWFPVIVPILRKYGIPEDFKYVPLVESGFLNSVSPRGASGFWQFMDETARQYGLEVSEQIDERFHIERSTVAACKYLKHLYRELKSWTLVAAAYNRGLGGLQRAITQQKTSDYYALFLNPETSRYVFRLIAVKELIENPGRYGLRFPKDSRYTGDRRRNEGPDTVRMQLAQVLELNSLPGEPAGLWCSDQQSAPQHADCREHVSTQHVKHRADSSITVSDTTGPVK